MTLKNNYDEMEQYPGDMTEFRRPPYSIRHPRYKYGYTQNMDTSQQNEVKYPESRYNTHNMSTAEKMIRAQGEQIRRMSAEEYLKDKSREAIKRNGDLPSKTLTEAGRKRAYQRVINQ